MIRSYDDYETVKLWFLFLAYSDHYGKKNLRITGVENNWPVIWVCSGCPADGTRVAASAFVL